MRQPPGLPAEPQAARGGRDRLQKALFADWLGRIAWATDAGRLRMLSGFPGTGCDVEADAGSPVRLNGLKHFGVDLPRYPVRRPLRIKVI